VRLHPNPPRLITVVVAVHWRSDFEFWAHRRYAIEAGVPPAQQRAPLCVCEINEHFADILSDGEFAVEAQLLGPGVEVLGDQHQLQPRFVAHEVLARQVAQAGVFGCPDAVLDVGPVTVPQLERGDVVVGLVGDEHLMAEPLGGVEQGQLGAGVGSFATGDHPHPLTPVVVEEVAQLDQPGTVTTGPVGFDRRHPIFLLYQHEGIAHGGVDPVAGDDRRVGAAELSGQEVLQEEYYGDYKEIGGVEGALGRRAGGRYFFAVAAFSNSFRYCP
jgi:hypothetical protein